MWAPSTSADGLDPTRQPPSLRRAAPDREPPGTAGAPPCAPGSLSGLRGGASGDSRRARPRPSPRLHRGDPARFRERESDAPRPGHGLHGVELRRRAPRRRRGYPGGRAERLRARPTPGPPRALRPGHGLLPLQQRGGRGPLSPNGSSGSDGSPSSTGTSTTATGRRMRSGTTRLSSSHRCTSGPSTRARAAPARETRPR